MIVILTAKYYHTREKNVNVTGLSYNFNIVYTF